MKVVKFLLGTDQPSIVIAAAGWSLLLGNMIVFHAIVFGIRPSPPLWQAVATGLALGIFLMPFFFISVSRVLLFMSPWEAVATLSAASVCPLAMWRLAELGVHGFFLALGCIVFIGAAFFAGRIIDRLGR